MKRVLISIIFFMVIMGFMNAEDKKNNELTVIVKGIEGTEGQIAIGLYDKEDDWGEEPFLGAYVKIFGDTISYTFKDLPKGTFAIAIYHDENMNEKLDKGLFKIPKEGYAFSNNVFGSFGPPEFEKTSFLLDGNIEIEIKLKY